MCKTMSGYFKKAPLSYVSIRLNTTLLPQLLDDQKAKLQQAMLSCDLVFYEKSVGKQFIFNNDFEKENNFNFKDVYRHGFLDVEKLNAFIIDEMGIEWRTTKYSKYDTFISMFNDVFLKFMSVSSVYDNARTTEIILSYVDMVVPEDDEILSDYFSGAIQLPVTNAFNEGVFSVGATTVSNVITNDQKIDISLEQLPQKFKKYLPEALIEPDQRFGMNIINPFVLSDKEGAEYALLLTRTSSLTECKLSEFNCIEASKPLHEITKDSFYKVINVDFCKSKWDYVEGD